MVQLSMSAGSSYDYAIALAASLPGALLFPLAMVLALRPKAVNVLGGVLGVIVASVIISIIGIVVHETYRHLDTTFLHLIPTCSFVLHISDQDSHSWMYVSLIVSAMSLVLLFARMRPVAAEIRKQQRLAAQILAAQKARKTEPAS
jgi:hypothetical protein